MEENKVQVSPCHYDFKRYVDIWRWCSYYHQIDETIKLKPQNALVVGIGDNIVGKMLSMHGIEAYTYDFDRELNPDFVGNVTDIDVVLQGKQFDVVLVCQILEHIPFSQFEEVLQKLRSVTTNVIMSLPHSAVKLTLSVKLHHCSTKGFTLAIHQWWKEIICRSESSSRPKSWWKRIQLHSEHFWEVGKGKHTERKVKKAIKKYFSIKKTFLATGNHDIVFYILFRCNN